MLFFGIAGKNKDIAELAKIEGLDEVADFVFEVRATYSAWNSRKIPFLC
jgi:hypothetical protein